RVVGKAIGHFLIELNEEGQLQLSRTHIIGHSLGSHVAGFVGKHIYRTTGGRIDRITGLDPAGPLFEFPFIGDDERLTRTDANFVDVIHTDSGILGFKSAIGDADYFPNGGSAIQPGCNIPPLHNIFEYVCSHQRSLQYFIESINSKKFVAKACDSWISYQMGFCNLNDNALFGEWASSNFTGQFFLRTSASSPYLLES
ncbi:lipase member H-B-like, partial [Photinus pyralis]|uniref:lipase member H-B-like n=1 Tax=Photinus pyralis TaxID=7054 RepID=UPI00126731DE